LMGQFCSVSRRRHWAVVRIRSFSLAVKSLFAASSCSNRDHVALPDASAFSSGSNAACSEDRPRLADGWIGSKLLHAGPVVGRFVLSEGRNGPHSLGARGQIASHIH
jgi:hypothetical protein